MYKYKGRQNQEQHHRLQYRIYVRENTLYLSVFSGVERCVDNGLHPMSCLSWCVPQDTSTMPSLFFHSLNFRGTSQNMAFPLFVYQFFHLYSHKGKSIKGKKRWNDCMPPPSRNVHSGYLSENQLYAF